MDHLFSARIKEKLSPKTNKTESPGQDQGFICPYYPYPAYSAKQGPCPCYPVPPEGYAPVPCPVGYPPPPEGYPPPGVYPGYYPPPYGRAPGSTGNPGFIIFLVFILIILGFRGTLILHSLLQKLKTEGRL